ncbi:hypothetical protein D3Z36_09695 [Lachnospiraceae bacterium]|nr:hypothetical protein [Lachnospiraceae bacterium]
MAFMLRTDQVGGSEKVFAISEIHHRIHITNFLSALPVLSILYDGENQIRELDLQADDYITISFSMPVLLRKIADVLCHIIQTECCMEDYEL